MGHTCRKNAGEDRRNLPDYHPKSPDELRTDLPNAWITGIGDVSKVSAADIPARIQELRVVENVEEFAPNLERFRFCDRDDLLQP